MTTTGDAQEKRGTRPDPFRWVIEHPAVVDAVVWGAVTLLLILFTLFIGAIGWWMPFTTRWSPPARSAAPALAGVWPSSAPSR